jgi:hypothetical protein
MNSIMFKNSVCIPLLVLINLVHQFRNVYIKGKLLYFESKIFCTYN